MVKLRNLILFVSLALWHGTPFYLWTKAWRDIQAEHLAQVRKMVWELKCQGKVYQDKDGFLWPKYPNR